MTGLEGLLTMCRKAGQLSMGFDPMKEALAEGKAYGIITAADISPKTEKEVRYYAEKYGVPTAGTDMTMEEIYRALGKKAGILTIRGEGFSRKAMSLCKAGVRPGTGAEPVPENTANGGYTEYEYSQTDKA